VSLKNKHRKIRFINRRHSSFRTNFNQSVNPSLNSIPWSSIPQNSILQSNIPRSNIPQSNILGCNRTKTRCLIVRIKSPLRTLTKWPSRISTKWLLRTRTKCRFHSLLPKRKHLATSTTITHNKTGGCRLCQGCHLCHLCQGCHQCRGCNLCLHMLSKSLYLCHKPHLHP